ncbi:hypothetical protein WSM22_14930 [Cytophagales bacterium WSM2-2]|nr:hypothetical protein WSM22_14930 [Cytophagales bacterium WSM2-2]
MPFPFKSLSLYRVKRTFTSARSNHAFNEGELFQYMSSSLNHYDGIEICAFKKKDSTKELIWHADESDLTNWATFFEPVPWPK